jgi:EmrB/QacA subfamily drug resistance transporter
MATDTSTRTTVPTTRPVVVLVCVCLGLFIAQVDTSAINLALPAMNHDLSGGLSGMQWAVDAYNVAFAALLLTGGTVGDRFGRRRMFRLGLATFVIGSVICAIAPTLAVVLIGRVVQGIGAAMIMPQTLAILTLTFRDTRARNRAMASWAAVAGIGLAVGPTLGGLLVDDIGWRYIFWLNVPIGIAALLLSIRNVPESRNPNGRRVDLPGQILGTLALASLTFVIVDGGNVGWTSPAVLALIAGVVVCFAAFVMVERVREEPMFPLGLLRRGQFSVATLVTTCMTFGGYGMLTITSIAFQQQRGASALTAGIELLPLPLAFTVFSPLVSWLATRVGPKIPMAAGTLVMGVSLLAYAIVGIDGNLLVIDVIYAAFGLGLALNTGPVLSVAVASVEPTRAGLAAGITNLARILGATLGIAVQGSVLAAIAGPATHGPVYVTGFSTAIVVGCVVEFVGFVATVTRIRNPVAATAG